jgi:hypothetical protein
MEDIRVVSNKSTALPPLTAFVGEIGSSHNSRNFTAALIGELGANKKCIPGTRQMPSRFRRTHLRIGLTRSGSGPADRGCSLAPSRTSEVTWHRTGEFDHG